MPSSQSPHRPEPFFSSLACRNRTACRQCRDTGPTGQAFRGSLVARGLVAGEAFDCPIGLPMVERSMPITAPPPRPDVEARPAPDQVEPAYKAELEAIAAEQATRSELEICRACEESTQVNLWFVKLTVCGRLVIDAFDPTVKTCGCVMDWKTRVPGAKCPLGKW